MLTRQRRQPTTPTPTPNSDLLLTPAHVATVITGQAAAQHNCAHETTPAGGEVPGWGRHLPMPEAGPQLPCGGSPRTPLVLL